jgi:methyltransferase (TIGR00027 family)
MQKDRASRTAEYMAAFRALESSSPPGRRLFDDPFARSLLRPTTRTLVRLARLPIVGQIVLSLVDSRTPGARTSGIARTRYIDDSLRLALDEGVDQVVILGAGFDCRAHRTAGIARARVFEVDHPDTQAAKRQRLSLAPGHGLHPVSYVATDFNQRRLQQSMADVGYDPARRTLFIWEGVTNYLDAPAVDAAFDWFAAAAPRSRVVFTYVHRRVLTDPASFAGGERLLHNLRRIGEPWTFGFDPAEVPGYMSTRGLEVLEDIGAADYRARYWPAEAVRMKGYEFYRVATVKVSGRSG